MAAPGSEALRIRVAAVVTLGGSVVLVRHRRGEAVYHLLPGGGVEEGETLQEGLVREVAEETGLVVAVGRPLFISDTLHPMADRSVLNVTFSAEVVGGELLHRPRDPRVEAVDLVDPSELARLDLRPPMAAELAGHLAGQGGGDTRYLGTLWTEDTCRD